MRILTTPRSAPPRRHRGVAAVELALLLPLLTLLLLGTIDFARLFYHHTTISNCARNGAMWAANSALVRKNSPYASVAAAVIADGSSLTPAITAGNVTQTAGTDGNGDWVEVRVDYPFTMLTSYVLGYKEITLTRTVRMRVLPDIPTG